MLEIWKPMRACAMHCPRFSLFRFLSFRAYLSSFLDTYHILLFSHDISSLHRILYLIRLPLTSSPRPKRFRRRAVRRLFQHKRIDAQLVPGGIQEYPSSVEVHSHLVDSLPLSCPPLPRYSSKPRSRLSKRRRRPYSPPFITLSRRRRVPDPLLPVPSLYAAAMPLPLLATGRPNPHSRRFDCRRRRCHSGAEA